MFYPVLCGGMLLPKSARFFLILSPKIDRNETQQRVWDVTATIRGKLSTLNATICALAHIICNYRAKLPTLFATIISSI